MNWKKTKIKDWINPVKWVSFLLSLVTRFVYAPHIVEQYHMRYTRCSDCVALGSCKHCGCSMPARASVFFEKDSVDPKEQGAEPKWGPIILSKKKWQKVKDVYDIRLPFEANDDF